MTRSTADLALKAGLVAAVGTLALSWYLLRNRYTHRAKSVYPSLPVYVLKNDAGVEVHISPVGAAITKLIVPDKAGQKADIVLGYERAENYVTAEPCTYFGVIVGRVANRIAKATFKIGTSEYKLLANNGPNALHGGALGLHKRTWSAQQVSDPVWTGVELTYDSPDGEEGYPGALRITVTYMLSRTTSELTTRMTAVSTATTPVNLAQHSYFNLAGHDSKATILDHVLSIPTGDHYTPVNDQLIPTGEITPTQGTPFDFTKPHPIGERIAQVPGGYDHNYVLFNLGPKAKEEVKNGNASEEPRLAASVCDPVSGRCMDVLTTAPGLQFYAGNFLDENVQGKAGVRYFKHAGFCLETQGFPDSVNQPNFPSVLIEPGVQYDHRVVYRFHNK